MSFQNIQAALDAAVSAISGLPPLQLENTSNIAKAGVAFARGTLVPSRTQQLTVGKDGKNQALGFYQLDLFYPLNAGTATGNAMADTVISSFPRGSDLTSGTTTVHIEVAYREGGRRVSDHYQIPVVLQWSAIVPGQ